MIRHLLYGAIIVICVGTASANEYPLHTAIESNNKEEFDLLLQDESIDINKQKKGITPLRTAVLLKEVYYIGRLVADSRIDLTIEDKYHRNVLEESMDMLADDYRNPFLRHITKSSAHITALVKSIHIKELITQRSYEMFSLTKNENVNKIGLMIRYNNYDTESLIDLISISTGWDDIRYDQNNRLLIDVVYGTFETNLLLMQSGHPLTIKTNVYNICDDARGTLLIDQAFKYKTNYIAAKLLDYGSPMPTFITDKEKIIPKLKNVYLCADEHDFSEKRRKMSISTLNFVRAQKLGKQAASRYKRMHKTNDRIQKKEAHSQIL